jgi:hypothetical protein
LQASARRRQRHRSLIVLALIAAAAGWALLQAYPWLPRSVGRSVPPPADERVMVARAGGVLPPLILISWSGNGRRVRR